MGDGRPGAQQASAELQVEVLVGGAAVRGEDVVAQPGEAEDVAVKGLVVEVAPSAAHPPAVGRIQGCGERAVVGCGLPWGQAPVWDGDPPPPSSLPSAPDSRPCPTLRASPQHLGRPPREPSTGQAPKAIQLLSAHELNITEISDAIGFSSPTYFNEVFKKHYQCTPAEFRKKLT